MAYWLVKSEPFKYSWDQFVADGRTHWDGVRNYQARNNLQAMKTDDEVLYYHSNEGMEIVGIARVVREAYPDPSTDDARWVVVDLTPVRPLSKRISLAQMKGAPGLENLSLIRQSRLSVCPVTDEEFDIIMQMSKAAD